MQMRPEIQIQSAIKALTDVVMPAIDTGNTLAQEQAKLVIGLLGLMAKQIPLQYRFDRDELDRLLQLSARLQATVGSGATVDALARNAAEASDVLERATVAPEQLQQAVRDLRTASGAVISAAFAEGDAAARSEVQQLVLGFSADQLLRERSWFLPQGWEPDPAAVPPIETLLGPTCSPRGGAPAAS